MDKIDDYMIPYLKENNWDDGIKNGFTAIVNEIEKEYNVSVGTETLPSVENNDSLAIAMFLYISVYLTVIINTIISRTKKHYILKAVIYFFILLIASFIIIPNIMFRIIILAVNLFIVLITNIVPKSNYSGRGGFFGGGGFSGGGFSGGGGSSGGGRKLKKFLV